MAVNHSAVARINSTINISPVFTSVTWTIGIRPEGVTMERKRSATIG
jgi:hypothetical protein